MFNTRDRETLVKVSRVVYREMQNQIKNNNHEEAQELGAMWDSFVRICGRLESKDEVL